MALAVLTTPTGNIKAESSRLVTAELRFGCCGKYITYFGEDAGVGRGVGPRCATDGRLVDDDGFVQVLESFDLLEVLALRVRFVQRAEKFRCQDAVNEARFARS